MHEQIINGKLLNEERETVLIYDNVTKRWHLDTTILKHYHKAEKQGWKQTSVTKYEDGTVCGGSFEASARAITIRNAEKRQMSEKQMENLSTEDEEDVD